MFGLALLLVVGGFVAAEALSRRGGGGSNPARIFRGKARADLASKARPFGKRKHFGFAKHMGPALAVHHVARLTRGRPQALQFNRRAKEAAASGNAAWLRAILYKAGALGWSVPAGEEASGRAAMEFILAAALKAGEAGQLLGTLNSMHVVCLEHGDPIPSGEAGIGEVDPLVALMEGESLDWITDVFTGTTTDPTKCANAKGAARAQVRTLRKRFGYPVPQAELMKLARAELARRAGIPATTFPYYLVPPPSTL